MVNFLALWVKHIMQDKRRLIASERRFWLLPWLTQPSGDGRKTVWMCARLGFGMQTNHLIKCNDGALACTE